MNGERGKSARASRGHATEKTRGQECPRHTQILADKNVRPPTN